ncbi:MAG: hypothetical protein Q9191_005152 [Dirinaria sp. TL-2023a]
MATQAQAHTSWAVELTDFLRQARSSSGVIRVSDALIENFKRLVAAKTTFSSGAVEDLVGVLDAPKESNLCKRLHSNSLQVECLHQDHDSSTAIEAPNKTEKTALGKQHLDWLIARFVEPERSDQQRRAIGAFALELLADSEENMARMKEPDQKDRLLALGRMVHAEKSEILRLIAGSIIREMLSFGLTDQQFWSPREMSQRARGFPRQPHTSQWVYDFEEFADDQRSLNDGSAAFQRVVLKAKLFLRKEVVVFAAAAIVGETVYTIKGVSAILVAIGTGLSFAMFSADVDPPLFFDIRIQNVRSIEHVDSHSQPLSQIRLSQRPRAFCLLMQFTKFEGSNYYINAKAGLEDSIMLVYDHPDDAKIVADALSKRWAEIHGRPLENMATEQLQNVQAEPDSQPLNLSKSLVRRSDFARDEDENLVELESDLIYAGRANFEDNVLDTSKTRYDFHGDAAVAASRTFSEVKQGNSETVMDKSCDLQENNVGTNIDGQSGRAVSGHARASFPFLDDQRLAVDMELQVPPQSRPEGSTLMDKSAVIQRPTDPAPTSTDSAGDTESNMQTDQRSTQHNTFDDLYGATPSPQLDRSSHLRQQSETPVYRPAVTEDIVSKDKAPKRTKLSHQMRDHNGQTISHLEEMSGQSVAKGSRKDKDVLLPPAHEASSSALAMSPSGSKKSTRKAMIRVHKSPEPSLQQPKKDPNAAHAHLSQKGKPLQPLQQPVVTAKSGKSKTAGKQRLPSNPLSATTQASASKNRDGSLSVSYPGSNTSLRNVPDSSVNWEEAYEPQRDENDAAKRKAAKPTRGRKPAANQKKSRTRPWSPRPSKGKASAISLNNQRSRRTAAVKANRAIQGIADDESPKATESSSPKTPEADSLTKASTMAFENRDLPIAIAPMVPAGKASNNLKVPAAAPSQILSCNNTTSQQGLSTSEITAQPAKATIPQKSLPATTLSAHPPSKALISPSPHRRVNSASDESSSMQKRDAVKDCEAARREAPSGDIHPGMPASINLLENTASIGINQSIDGIIGEQMNASGNTTSKLSKATSREILPRGKHHLPHQFPMMEVELKQTRPAISTELGLPPPRSLQKSPQAKGSLSEDSKMAIESVNEPARMLTRAENYTEAESHQQMVTEIEQPFFNDAMEFVDEPDRAVAVDTLQTPVQNEVRWPSLEDNHPLVDVKSDHPKVTDRATEKRAPVSRLLTAPKLQSALSGIPHLQSVQSEQIAATNFGARLSQGKSIDQGRKRHKVAREWPTDKVEPGPRAGQKRRQDQPDGKRIKKSRITEEEGTHSARKEQLDGQHSSTSDIPGSHRKLNVHRKPNIVHFDCAGPANQGSSAMKKRKRPLAQDTSNADSIQLMIDQEGETWPDQSRISPKKNGPTPPKKRQKVEAVKPSGSAVKKPVPNAAKPPKVKWVERSQVASSQTSRVDEFGSPRPLHDVGNAVKALPKALLQDSDILLEPLEVLEADDDFEPSYPEGFDLARQTGQDLSEYRPMTGSSVAVSVNSKHRPSSPLAPSNLVAGLTAHEQKPSGQLVDIHTAKVIEPQKPQDPFLETARERPNAFLERLKRASEMRTDEGQTRGNDQIRSSHHGIQHDDPEKTLVDESAFPDKDVSGTVSGNSSDSGSSSSTIHEPSNDGDTNGILAWRKALEPHEQNMLKVLDRIGRRIINTLGDRESRLQGLVEEYQREGSLILDEFSESCMKEYADRKAKGESTKMELADSLQQAQKELSGKVEKFKKEMAGLRTERETRQGKADAGVERLLSMCEE